MGGIQYFILIVLQLLSQAPPLRLRRCIRPTQGNCIALFLIRLEGEIEYLSSMNKTCSSAWIHCTNPAHYHLRRPHLYPSPSQHSFLHNSPPPHVFPNNRHRHEQVRPKTVDLCSEIGFILKSVNPTQEPPQPQRRYHIHQLKHLGRPRHHLKRAASNSDVHSHRGRYPSLKRPQTATPVAVAPLPPPMPLPTPQSHR